MPLLWLSLAFIAGIIIADDVTLPVTTWLILAGLALTFSLPLFVFQRIRARRFFFDKPPSLPGSLAALLLLALTLGGYRYQHSLPDLNNPDFIASHNDTGERVSMMGVVDAFPDLRDNTLTLTADITPVDNKEEQDILVEYETGRYYRQFSVSEIINQADIDAKLKDGILHLTLPKVEKATPKKIVVKAG